MTKNKTDLTNQQKIVNLLFNRKIPTYTFIIMAILGTLLLIIGLNVSFSTGGGFGQTHESWNRVSSILNSAATDHASLWGGAAEALLAVARIGASLWFINIVFFIWMTTAWSFWFYKGYKPVETESNELNSDKKTNEPEPIKSNQQDIQKTSKPEPKKTSKPGPKKTIKPEPELKKTSKPGPKKPSKPEPKKTNQPSPKKT